MSETKSNTVTKGQWKKSATHEGITLPSGAVVDIRIPNLPAMVKAGKLPNQLVEVATQAAATGQVPDDLLERLDEYNNFLVVNTVAAPEVEESDVPDLPYEDVEMIVAFATRQIDTDAIGHHLAGLETVDSFRRFRGLDARYPNLLDV